MTPNDRDGEDIGYSCEVSEEGSIHESDQEFIDDRPIADEETEHLNREELDRALQNLQRRNAENRVAATPQKRGATSTPATAKKQKSQKQIKSFQDSDGEAMEVDGEDPEQADKGVRAQHRALKPIPQIGIGSGPFLDKIGGIFKTVRKPWRERSYESFGIMNSSKVKEWLLSPSAQLTFAQKFSVPLMEDHGYRVFENERDLSDDKGKIRKNWTAKTIHAAVSTGPRTYMERMCSRKAASVWVSQFNTDRVGDLALDNGPEGGMQGISEVVFWRFSRNDHNIFSTELLNLVTHLCEGARRGSDVPNLWPAISTHWTTTSCNTKRCVEGARIMTSQNMSAVGKHVNIMRGDDVDDNLLGRIIDYRAQNNKIQLDSNGNIMSEYGHNDPKIVPPYRQTCDITLASDEPYMALQMESTNVSGMFDVFLFQDVVHGQDDAERNDAFKIDMVKIQAKYPGMDPLLAIHQIATTDQRLAVEVCSVVRHMCDVLGHKFDGTLAELFQTSTAPICRVCCEAQLPWAVMKYASMQKLNNVHFGGFRGNPRDKVEAFVWSQFEESLFETRKQHYNFVADQVALDINDRRNARRPVLEYHLDYYDGQHYRRVPKEEVDERYEEIVPGEYDCNDSFVAAVHAAKNELLQDSEFYYIADGRPWARNTGVWLRIDPDAFCAFEKRPSKEHKEDPGLIQPSKISPIVQLYLENCTMHDDPLRIMEISPHVPDFTYLTQNRHKLPEPLMRLVDTMQKLWDHGDDTNITEADIRWQELSQLYGAKQHRIKRVITSTLAESPLDEMADMCHAAIVQSVKSTLTSMRYGELRQWSYAAHSVVDLETQGRRNAEVWVFDNKKFETMFEHLTDTDTASFMCHDSARSLLRIAKMTEQLDLKLSFSNRTLMSLLEYNTCAHFSYQRKQYGSAIKIADMAHCVQVVVRNGNMHQLMIIDYKFPGAGADSLVNLYCELHRAYGSFLATDGTVQSFYKDEASKDIVAKHITPFSMATYLGSALSMLKGNEIDQTSNHSSDAGLLGFLTEIGKLQAQSANTQDQVTNIECFLNESGCGGGTKREPWTTTRGLAPVRVNQMFGFPMALFCANRPQKNTTKSIFESGRIIVTASATRDDNNGVMYINSRSQAAASGSTENKGMYFDTLSMLDKVQKQDRPKIRPITQESACSSRQAMLRLHMIRRCVPFLARTMQLDVRKLTYSFQASFTAFNSAARSVTVGLRRNYLLADNQMNRTGEGPWETCMAYGMHVSLITDQCIERAIRMNYKTSLGQCMVPMDNIMPDVVKSLLFVPICIMTMLSSLHLWLFATVLDCSIFALSGSLLFGMGFNKNCPLLTLAAAMRGETLTDYEQQQYEDFCASIFPVITAGVTPPQITNHTIRNIAEGHIHLPNMADFATLLSWTEEGAQDAIHAVEQTQSDATVSVYVAPRLKIVQREVPEWVQVKKNNNKWGKKNSEDFATNTPQQIAATLYANGQTEHAHIERFTNGQRPTPWEHPPTYWQAAHEGMRLPKTDGHDNDINSFEFDPVWETGHWYNDTIKTAAQCKGILKYFLVLAGCNKNTTYTQFFQKLFALYFKIHGMESCAQKIHNSRPWRRPILEDTGNGFCWAVQTHKNIHGVSVGVESTLCINNVLLVIMQALCCQEWKPTRDGHRAVSHLRVISQASLEIMTLLLHIHLDKAAVPPNDGMLQLMHTSPILDSIDSPAAITFKPRMHIESCITEDCNNILSVRNRTANEVMLRQLFDGSYAMYYSRILQNNPEICLMDKPYEYFPFPPESVYHMAAHYEMMQTALERYSKEHRLAHYQNMQALLEAMLQYGESVSADVVRHIPATLTWFTTQQQVEIPCVTYRDGLSFVLRRQQNCFVLQPVKSGLSNIESMLISPDDDISIPLHRLSDAMSYGLVQEDNGRFDLNLQAPSHETERQRRFPFYFFPIIAWPQLVQVSTGKWMMELENSHVEYLSLTDHMQNLEKKGYLWSNGIELVQQYLAGHQMQLPDTVKSLCVSKGAERSKLVQSFKDPNADLITAHIFVSNQDGVTSVFNGIDLLVEAIKRDSLWPAQRSQEYNDFVVRKPGMTDLNHIFEDDNGDHVYFNNNGILLAEVQCLKNHLKTVRRQQTSSKDLVMNRTKVDEERRLMHEINRRELAMAQPKKEYINQNQAPWTGLDVPKHDSHDQVAMVIPYDDGKWLKDGCYLVQYLYKQKNADGAEDQETRYCRIDFCLLSMCHIREGTPMILTASEQILQALDYIGLQLPITMEDKTASHEILCFYVLGVPVDHNTNMNNALARVCFAVNSDTELHQTAMNYTIQTAQRWIIDVPLYCSVLKQATLRVHEDKDHPNIHPFMLCRKTCLNEPPIALNIVSKSQI